MNGEVQRPLKKTEDQDGRLKTKKDERSVQKTWRKQYKEEQEKALDQCRQFWMKEEKWRLVYRSS